MIKKIRKNFYITLCIAGLLFCTACNGNQSKDVTNNIPSPTEIAVLTDKPQFTPKASPEVTPETTPETTQEMTYGDFTYSITSNQVTIVAYSGKSSTLVIPSKIHGRSVVEIGASSFANNEYLTKVTIPSGVICINDNAFYSCPKLKTVIVPNSMSKIGFMAFANCSALTNMHLPDGITMIDEYAFSECTSLKEINIPSSITDISAFCFYKCISLEELSLPDSIISIGGCAFSGCKKLNINMPPSLTTIGEYAFENCESLKQIILTGSQIIIYPNAFLDCKSVNRLEINGSVISIDENAFKDCFGLEKIVLSESVRTLPILSGCNLIESIHIDRNNPYLTSEEGVVFTKDRTTLLRYPSAKDALSYNIPKTVKTIYDYAFSGLSRIKEITIPNSVTYLGSGIFYGSTSIEKVTLPAGLTTIPMYAFYGSSLKTVTLSNKITKIGFQAFAYCKNLTKITIPASVESLDEDYNDDPAPCPPLVGLDNLVKFVVDKKNKTYTAIDGVLYSKNDNSSMSLICYPSKKTSKSFTVPEGTAYISTKAFYKCDNLKKLYLPHSMTSIGEFFKNCSDLKIMLPTTITKFVGPEHLTDFPIFEDCNNCYLYVKANSKAYQYCSENGIPYKIWK